MKTLPMAGFNDVYVTETGTILLNNQIVRQTTGRYRTVTINGNELSVHRIVAETFIPNPDNKLYVNHIDGDPWNNCVENLEWVTPSENSLHAYRTGLRSDNKFLKVKDMETGEVFNGHSLQAVATAIDVNAGEISAYLKSKRQWLFKSRYVIAYEDEDWQRMLLMDSSIPVPGKPKAIIGKHSETGNMIVFSSCSAVSEYLTIPTHRIRTALQGVTRKPIQGWHFEYYGDPLPIDVVKSSKEENYKQTRLHGATRKPTPITVQDTVTGLIREWESTQSFANSLNVSKSTLQKRIWKHKVSENSGMFGKYLVTYKR